MAAVGNDLNKNYAAMCIKTIFCFLSLSTPLVIVITLTSDPPEIDVESLWVHAGEGESVTLVCRVYSNPAAKVSFITNLSIITTTCCPRSSGTRRR